MFAPKQDFSLSGKTYFLFDSLLLKPDFFYSRAEREYVVQEDFMKAVRKVSDNKKLESKLDYKPL